MTGSGARDDRYPLRLRLWIMVGSAAAASMVALFGGLALLRALDLR